MRRTGLSLLTLFAVLTTATANASLIASWNFNDDNAVADTLAANLTVTNLLPGTGLSNVSIDDQASARGFNPSTSAADALGRADYWNFTLTAATGYEFDLASLSLDAKRGTSGPVNFQVYVDSTLTGAAGTATTTYTPFSTDLSGFTNLTSANFFLVAWGASNNGNAAQFFLDNLNLNGEVSAIVTRAPIASPEPGSMVLLGIGGWALAGIRRRATRTATT